MREGLLSVLMYALFWLVVLEYAGICVVARNKDQVHLVWFCSFY